MNSGCNYRGLGKGLGVHGLQRFANQIGERNSGLGLLILQMMLLLLMMNPLG